jgi:hypothetical protein
LFIYLILCTSRQDLISKQLMQETYFKFAVHLTMQRKRDLSQCLLFINYKLEVDKIKK